jgi:hypothetical protein
MDVRRVVSNFPGRSGGLAPRPRPGYLRQTLSCEAVAELRSTPQGRAVLTAYRRVPRDEMAICQPTRTDGRGGRGAEGVRCILFHRPYQHPCCFLTMHAHQPTHALMPAGMRLRSRTRIVRGFSVGHSSWTQDRLWSRRPPGASHRPVRRRNQVQVGGQQERGPHCSPDAAQAFQQCVEWSWDPCSVMMGQLKRL